MPILRACLVCGKARACLFRGRCEGCAPAYKGTRSANYGRDHQQARAELATTLPAPCAYGCGTVLRADSDWVAAHVVDGDPTSARVVACALCNQRAKGRPMAVVA